MTYSDLTDKARELLVTTEANGIIVARAIKDPLLFVQPNWEAESGACLEKQALACAIDWADTNGVGDLVVTWAFRDEAPDLL